MAVPIILDCDPGHDDAVAIVVAARHAELLGITTVAGNAPLDRTTHNALVVRELLGVDVPVHTRRGAAAASTRCRPRRPSTARAASTAPTCRRRRRPLDGTDAVGFIVDTCRRVEGVWLVGVGPLTNVALALRAAPDLADRIAGISVMGGGTFGNRSPVAEFNIWADPEAAAVVFGYGGPLVMAGLDVTYQLLATPARIDAVRRQPGPARGHARRPVRRSSPATYVGRHDGIAGAAVHDPCAVLALTHPDLFERERRHVAVETAGALTRGMTVIDRRTLEGAPGRRTATC